MTVILNGPRWRTDAHCAAHGEPCCPVCMGDELAEERRDADTYRMALNGEQENNEKLVALLEETRTILENIREAGSSDYVSTLFYQEASRALRAMVGDSAAACVKCDRLIASYDSGDYKTCWRCRQG